MSMASSLLTTFLTAPAGLEAPQDGGTSQARGRSLLLALQPASRITPSSELQAWLFAPISACNKGLIIPSLSPLTILFLSVKKISRTVGHLSLLMGPMEPYSFFFFNLFLMVEDALQCCVGSGTHQHE